ESRPIRQAVITHRNTLIIACVVQVDRANRWREHECKGTRLEPGEVALTVLPRPDEFHDSPSDTVPPDSLEAYCNRVTQSRCITGPGPSRRIASGLTAIAAPQQP